MARMVPVGIDFWASRRSPDLLEPAMIPGKEGAEGRRKGPDKVTPSQTSPSGTAIQAH